MKFDWHLRVKTNGSGIHKINHVDGYQASSDILSYPEAVMLRQSFFRTLKQAPNKKCSEK